MGTLSGGNQQKVAARALARARLARCSCSSSRRAASTSARERTSTARCVTLAARGVAVLSDVRLRRGRPGRRPRGRHGARAGSSPSSRATRSRPAACSRQPEAERGRSSEPGTGCPTARTAPPAQSASGPGDKRTGRCERWCAARLPETAALFVVLGRAVRVLLDHVAVLLRTKATRDNVINILQNAASDRDHRLPGDAAADRRPVRPLGRLGGRVHGDGHGDPRGADRCGYPAAVRGAAADRARLRASRSSPRSWSASSTASRSRSSGINALITTLGTLAIFRGLTHVMGNAQTIRIDGFGVLGRRPASLDIPIPVCIFVAVVVIFIAAPALHDLRPVDVRDRREPDRGPPRRHPDEPRHLHRLPAVGGPGGRLAGSSCSRRSGGASVNADQRPRALGRHGRRARRREPVRRPRRHRRARSWPCSSSACSATGSSSCASSRSGSRSPNGALLLAAVGFDQAARPLLTRTTARRREERTCGAAHWSPTLGKRVKTGTWTDQQTPTLEEARRAIAEAGDEFGLKAGRREVAAQLVDYFMEEAKVVYVIYEVWTKGFLDWLDTKGVAEEERQAELDRLKALLAFPDGQPLDPQARWEALGAFAGRLGNRIRSYDITGAEADRDLTTLARVVAPAPRPWRRPHGRPPRVRRASLRRGVARGLLPLRPGAVHPGALHAVRRSGRPVRGHDRAESLHLVRGDAGASLRPRATGHVRPRGARGPLGRRLRPLRLGRPLDARRRRRGHGLAGPRAVRVRGHAGEARLGLEQGRHLLLLRALLPRAREAAGRALGASGPRRRPAACGAAAPTPTRRSRSARWTIYKTLEAIPEERYQRIGHEKPQLPVIQPS